MTEKIINVLIFPAGSEIAIEIFHSLRYNLHLEIFGASGKADHARYLYENTHYFEGDYQIGKAGFIERFNELLNRLQIDVVFPTHDTIALFLAENHQRLKAKVLTSPVETAKIAREKKLTYEIFKNFNFCPVIYTSPYDDAKYPLFLKPNIGQGGKETLIAKTKECLLAALNANPDLLACELLPGQELSVDCFTNRKGELLFVGPRTRERVQMGISFHSAMVSLTPEVQEIAERINQTVRIRGTWFFQLKKDQSGRFKLLEFAVRQASTMGLYRQIGVNFSLLSIFDMMDKEVKIIKNEYYIELDRCLYNRYKINYEYDCVYIDFDDTIIVNDKVNEIAIKYLYYCRNRSIRICLLTKHRYDLNATLAKYGICKDLFDEIILISMEDDKAKHITLSKSIFIDNYFFDRERVKNELNIPVFDVDAVESLMK